ncbi:MAG: hypothetical protein IT355_18905 [Gemmatimonadaceae bacterium]|nr:hypothetical protein [Gemmatimonadaceae bacterium]
MHRQLHSIDDFSDRFVATVLREAAASRDECMRCVGPALLAGFDERFRALPATAPGARLAQRLLRDGVTMISALYSAIGVRADDAIIGLATVCANTATYRTPALVDAVIRTGGGLAPWLNAVLEADGADELLTEEAWEALGAAAIGRLCDGLDGEAPGARAERDGAAAVLVQLTLSGAASHRWPVWRERLFTECDSAGSAGCRDAAAVLLADGLSFAPLSVEAYLRLLPALTRHTASMSAILRHPWLDSPAVATAAAAILIEDAGRRASAVGAGPLTAEAMQGALCGRQLRLAPDHPVVLAVAAWFSGGGGGVAEEGRGGASLARDQAPGQAPITYRPL